MSGSSRERARPAVSVVIAAMSGCEYLERCLAALAAQSSGALESGPPSEDGGPPSENGGPPLEGNIEIIVVQEEGNDETVDQAHQVAALVGERYPAARLLQRRGQLTLGQLRAAGIGAAAGEIVAITEDHCIPAADWCRRLVEVHAQQAAPAIGGAVDNGAVQRLVDWTAYWCEYSAYASPLAHGPVQSLAAANVSYKRAALEQLGPLGDSGFREGGVHARLAAAGGQLWSDPALRVWHRKHFTVRSYCRERFAYSRWYAGERGQQLGRLRNLLYLGATPLLPFVLLLRLARRTQKHAGEAAHFARALPYLLLFVCVWAAGEAAGLLWGPGASEYELR